MLSIISPSKTQDFSKCDINIFSQTRQLDSSNELIGILKNKSQAQISKLMSLSEKLSKLNVDRFQKFKIPFTLDNAKQAILAFKGDVYIGLEAEQFSGHDLNHAQKHLRILSGLYGILRPLDLMQAYRLEMGSRFRNRDGKSLYDLWGSKLTDSLNIELAEQKSKVLINLASIEYFGSVQTDKLDAEIISPVFKDYSNGKYKILSFFAKKARGSMAAYIIKNRIDSPSKLKQFDVDGYRYSEEDSTPSKPVFLRRQK